MSTSAGLNLSPQCSEARVPRLWCWQARLGVAVATNGAIGVRRARGGKRFLWRCAPRHRRHAWRFPESRGFRAAGSLIASYVRYNERCRDARGHTPAALGPCSGPNVDGTVEAVQTAGVRSKVPSEVCHGSIRMAVVSDHEGRPIELIGSNSDTASPTHSL